ncbi:transmembrane protein 176B-like [Colossoma macropomum]|uniref:transmembrane protein 176B-like n=1 Tax=Colossoma macropomum TaxID=42526 RepID=UPI0018650FA4|nr:transmembrane protein 176B-like [Colossoma macropomum]
MSLTISRAEGVTVFTVTSNPKSKWPLICQLLSTLCCSPVCSVSQSMKQQLGSINKVLGTLQILFGILSVVVWCIFIDGPIFTYAWVSIFLFGGVLIAAGITCILADKFPSPCLVSFMVLVNLVSVGLAVTAIVFCSVALRLMYFDNNCNPVDYLYYSFHHEKITTVSPLKKAQINELLEECERYQDMLKFVQGGVEIMTIVFASLQICLTISSCVLSLKALFKKKKGDEMEDPEFYKLLMEEGLTSPAC